MVRMKMSSQIPKIFQKQIISIQKHATSKNQGPHYNEKLWVFCLFNHTGKMSQGGLLKENLAFHLGKINVRRWVTRACT